MRTVQIQYPARSGLLTAGLGEVWRFDAAADYFHYASNKDVVRPESDIRPANTAKYQVFFHQNRMSAAKFNGRDREKFRSRACAADANSLFIDQRNDAQWLQAVVPFTHNCTEHISSWRSGTL